MMVSEQLIDFNCNLCSQNENSIVYPASVSNGKKHSTGFSCTNDGHGEFYQVVRCNHCHLVYCSPRPKAEFLEDAYKDVKDEIYNEEKEGRVQTFRKNLKHIARYKKEGELLDVGCSIGTFLNEAKEQGWKVRGVEPSEWCVTKGKELYQIDIRQGTFRDLLKEEKRYDVVTLWDVLEHVDDPLDALKSCGSALKDDGVFVFSTVDIGSWYAKILGKKWPWLMRMHIFYFDRKTIKAYLKKAQLELLEIRVYKHIVTMQYLLYKLKSINVFLYKVTKLFVDVFRLHKKYITIGMGDFMEVYTKKMKS